MRYPIAELTVEELQILRTFYQSSLRTHEARSIRLRAGPKFDPALKVSYIHAHEEASDAVDASRRAIVEINAELARR